MSEIEWVNGSMREGCLVCYCYAFAVSRPRAVKAFGPCPQPTPPHPCAYIGPSSFDYLCSRNRASLFLHGTYVARTVIVIDFLRELASPF